jgi:hypothetical protein
VVIKMEQRFSRQSFLGTRSQKQIENTVVGICGLGGGGSHVVQQLAHIGFRQYRIFDGDVVEVSNLNRLIGATIADAADQCPKTRVATRQIQGLQPAADILSFQGRWQESHDELKRCDLVFGCIDSFLERDELERFCRRYLTVYIDIGMDVVIGNDGQAVMGGQVIVSVPDSACMRCYGFINDERLALEAQRYGVAGDRPQVVWPNGVLASTAVGLGVDLVTDWSGCLRGSAYLEYDGRLGTIKSIGNALHKGTCTHYFAEEVGDPVFKEL